MPTSVSAESGPSAKPPLGWASRPPCGQIGAKPQQPTWSMRSAAFTHWLDESNVGRGHRYGVRPCRAAPGTQRRSLRRTGAQWNRLARCVTLLCPQRQFLTAGIAPTAMHATERVPPMLDRTGFTDRSPQPIRTAGQRTSCRGPRSTRQNRYVPAADRHWQPAAPGSSPRSPRRDPANISTRKCPVSVNADPARRHPCTASPVSRCHRRATSRPETPRMDPVRCLCGPGSVPAGRCGAGYPTFERAHFTEPLRWVPLQVVADWVSESWHCEVDVLCGCVHLNPGELRAVGVDPRSLGGDGRAAMARLTGTGRHGCRRPPGPHLTLPGLMRGGMFAGSPPRDRRAAGRECRRCSVYQTAGTFDRPR